jgi:hypothetical protein
LDARRACCCARTSWAEQRDGGGLSSPSSSGACCSYSRSRLGRGLCAEGIDERLLLLARPHRRLLKGCDGSQGAAPAGIKWRECRPLRRQIGLKAVPVGVSLRRRGRRRLVPAHATRSLALARSRAVRQARGRHAGLVPLMLLCTPGLSSAGRHIGADCCGVEGCQARGGARARSLSCGHCGAEAHGEPFYRHSRDLCARRVHDRSSPCAAPPYHAPRSEWGRVMDVAYATEITRPHIHFAAPDSAARSLYRHC